LGQAFVSAVFSAGASPSERLGQSFIGVVVSGGVVTQELVGQGAFTQAVNLTGTAGAPSSERVGQARFHVVTNQTSTGIRWLSWRPRQMMHKNK
jgi:hypothetical protein